MRSLLPKDEQDDTRNALGAIPAAPKSNKRKCISSACIPCRKRKSKCDGGMPDCSTCVAVYQTPCFYDIDSDHRRKAALKRDITTLEGRNSSLNIIFRSIRTSSESEVAEIVQQIRAEEGIDIDVLAESLEKNKLLSERSERYESPGRLERSGQSEQSETSGGKSAEGELSNLIGRPAHDLDGVVKHYGHTSHLGLVKTGERSPIHVQTSDWTTVIRDNTVIQHLMDLYFCWSHPFYPLFPRDKFLSDYTNGRTQYCSSLLVNAVLAFGCQYSDLPEARLHQHDPSTTGDHFFAEAKRLLIESDSSNLTTVQALAIMGLREASCGRDSSGFQLAGRSMRMLIELGLHLSFGSAGDKLDPIEVEARKSTFWGCFVYDTAWSICIGRIGQLPRTAINIDLPRVEDPRDMEPWSPYTDWAGLNLSAVDKPNLTHSLAYHFSLLSEIVNDTVFMFYAPRERFTSKKLLGFHERYMQWMKNLPSNLGLHSEATPHVMTLHIYYQTVVLHLFRPFLKVDITTSSLDPRKICAECASKIAISVSKYRRTYGLRRVPIVMTHCIFASSIVHLINLPKPSDAHDLAQSLVALREMSSNHAFAIRYIGIVFALAKQWNIHLPDGVAQYNLPPVNAHSSQDYLGYPSPSSSNQSQPQDQILGSCIANELPFAAVRSSPRTFTQPAEMFWTPFKGQSVPLHAPEPQATGPMDISAMLAWDLNRDGFQVANFGDFLGPPLYQPNGHADSHAQLNGFMNGQAPGHVNGHWPPS